MKVLIVDDSRALRSHMRSMMQSLGWQTEEAENGLCALNLLRGGGSFELALLDVNMPEMGGMECVKRLTREHPEHGTKLMMVTSESEFTLIAEALELGADEFLIKPFTRQNLLAKLRLMMLPCTT